MIQHPTFAFLFLLLLILLGVTEVVYYRAGLPKSMKWFAFLFLCGACTVVSGALAVIPEISAMFQSVGASISLGIAALLGGLGAVYTGPRYAREAEKVRQERNRR